MKPALVVLATLAFAAVAGAAAVAWMIAMPGDSWKGALEPLPGADSAAADRLRADVIAIASREHNMSDPAAYEAAAAHKLAQKLELYRVEVDERDETVGKRIRDAEIEKIPVTIVYGDKESDESLAIRERGGEQSTKSLAELREHLSSYS